MRLGMKPGSSNVAKAVTATVAATTLLVPALSAVQPAFALTLPDRTMEAVWNRTDRVVQEGQVARSWMWGPNGFYTGYEPYLEGPNGQHLVVYFDKSRMEVNNPNGDRNNPFFVTNGLLVVDLMTGRVQMGNNSFEQRQPANLPVAGDVGTSVNAPTYASLAAFASLNGDKRAPNRTGQPVAEGLQRTGGVGTVNNLAGYARYSIYEPTTGHNIPDVFWKFMNQKGLVYVNNRYAEETVIDWMFAMGYPLTEPYWIPIQVGSEQRWVLMQAFQRRILTYSPGNPAGFQVEMGNVGRTYYDWRYAQAPAPIGIPAISISPNQGDGNTTIEVSGANFPRNAQVSVQVTRAGTSYNKGVASARSDGNGAFKANFKLPADATKYSSVTISAISGAASASADFRVSLDPRIDVSPKGAVLNGSTVTVTGGGFPAGTDVRIGILFDGQANPEYPTRVRSGSDGTFRTSFNIGTRPSGSRFIVFATAEGNIKANYSDRITVYNRPVLQVLPVSGPVGVNVTLQGSGWPANQQLTIGYKGVSDSSEAFLPSLVTVDRNGNFSVPIYLPPSFGSKRQVIFSATMGGTGVRVEAVYTITPPQAQPAVSINPVALAVGQSGSISGSNWTPGTSLTVSINGAGAQQDVATANVAGNGTFGAVFNLHQRWANAGIVQVVVRSSNGLTASTPLTVIPTGGTNVLEYGLNASVQTYTGVGGAYVKVYGQGWQPGLNLIVSVVSVGGDVNVGVANAVVKADGTWQASFDKVGVWVTRADVGVRVSDASGRYFSGRRLPVANLTKVNGGTYQVSGANWAPTSKVSAVLQLDGNDQDGLGSATVDGNGNFAFNVFIDRSESSRSVKVTSSGGNGIQYEAIFGIDR